MRRGASHSSFLFPEGVRNFCLRRSIDLMSMVLMGWAFYLLLCFFSYHSGDLSLNTATDEEVRNWGGVWGSYLSDFLLRGLGWASFPLVLVLGVWGWSFWTGYVFENFSHKAWRSLFLRFLFLPLFLIFSAMSLTLFFSDLPYAYSSSYGGIVGTLFAEQGEKIWEEWIPQCPLWILKGVILLGNFFLLFYILGLRKEVYKALGKKLFEKGAFCVSLCLGGWRFMRSYEAPSALRNLEEKREELEEFLRPSLSWSQGLLSFFSPFSGKPLEEDFPRDRPFFSRKKEEEEIPENFSERSFWSDASLPFERSEEKKLKTKESLWKDDVEREEDLDQEFSQPVPLSKKETVSSKKISSSLEGKRDGYTLPPLDLLQQPKIKPSRALEDVDYEAQARDLEAVLADFGVKGEIVQVHPGPVVTLYELKPAAGTKSSRVIGLADDIARSMSAVSARVAVVPGRNVIGIELPNQERETVYLRELLSSSIYERHGASLSLVLGKDIGGAPVITDLARMPHLLVAGTTGSGKSVAINTMILSLLYKMSPDQCKFIMIDPKMLELSVYDGIPHLLAPVVTDPKKAIVALKWVVKEMENRYRDMSKLGVRNIAGYNTRITEAMESGEILIRRVQTGFDSESGRPVFENQPLDLKPLPLIVVIVDEMADLMLVAGKEIESAVQRLAQMARAAGIHLIMATQRPSVDVITGTIKANFPTRMSFQVTSKIDSRTILGEPGAEQLLGQGDMLFMSSGGRLMRVHGPYASDMDVEKVVQFLKDQGEPHYIQGLTEDQEEGEEGEKEAGGQEDPLYEEAVELIRTQGKVSTSFIQRHLQIGYNRAARIVDIMEKKGVISSANHVGKREIL